MLSSGGGDEAHCPESICDGFQYRHQQKGLFVLQWMSMHALSFGCMYISTKVLVPKSYQPTLVVAIYAGDVVNDDHSTTHQRLPPHLIHYLTRTMDVTLPLIASCSR